MFLLPILLSPGFSLSVAPGQAVQKGTVLATSAGVAPTYTINIAQALGITIRKAKSSVKKRPGEYVLLGEVLAEKPGLFAGERIVSQVAGVVSMYRADTSDLLIMPFLDSSAVSQKELVSPIDGVITVCDTEKIVIQTSSPVIVAKHGIGKTKEGEVMVLTPNAGSEVPYYAINAEMKGKILAGGVFTRDALIKAVGMDAHGILTTQIADEDLAYMQQKHTVPILIIRPEDFPHIQARHGKSIYMDGLSKSIVV